MKIINILTLINEISCPYCSAYALELSEPGNIIQCSHCKNSYEYNNNVADLVIKELLNDFNNNELNAFTGEMDQATINKLSNKDEWSPIMSHQMKLTIKIVLDMMKDYANTTLLYSVGSGSGSELQQILPMKPFNNVFSSDINVNLTKIVPKTLMSIKGNLGLFTCDFFHCPRTKRENTLGLVFHALHHTHDAHAALKAILKNNFDYLIIVEPVTNWFIDLLAIVGYAKQIEYSGNKPDWMYIKSIKKIAHELGYQVHCKTWWEPPPVFTRNKWLIEHPTVWKGIFSIITIGSWLTNFVNFGSMAAIHLRKRTEHHEEKN